MRKLSGLVVLVLVGACAGYVGCSSSATNGGGGAGAGGAPAGAGGGAGLTGGAGRTGDSGGAPAEGGNGGQASGGGGIGTAGSGGATAAGGGGVQGGGQGGNAGHPVTSGGTGGGGAGAGGTAATAGSGGLGIAGDGSAGKGGAAGSGPPPGSGGAGQAGGGSAGAGGAANLPDVLILLDRSGSMNDLIDGTPCTDSSCADGSKWTLVKTALGAALPPYETTVRWGLKLFGSSDNSSCTVTYSAEVPPALANAGAVAALLDRVAARTSTPTTAAEKAAAGYLVGIRDASPKFIVLITDGIPTCGTSACAPDANGQIVNQCDDANAIAAVKAVHDDQGIPTIVVGIGTDLGAGATTLSQMANAGGFPRNASPQYYPVSSAGELMAAITEVAAIVTSGP